MVQAYRPVVPLFPSDGSRVLMLMNSLNCPEILMLQNAINKPVSINNYVDYCQRKLLLVFITICNNPDMILK